MTDRTKKRNELTELPEGYMRVIDQGYVSEFKKYESSVVELVKHNVSDEDVARAAWVSTVGEDSRTKDPSKIKGLINYLMRDRHGSPFEHGSFTFFVKTPLFVRSEFHRHRIGWSYNEESGRYSELKPHFYVIPRDRKIVQTGKVGHYQFEHGSDEVVEMVRTEQEDSYKWAYNSYKYQLQEGVSREVARQVLPLNQMTSFYATCNPRSLMAFLSLRTERDDAMFVSHPQWEIQNVADQIEASFKELMPLTWEAFEINKRVSP